MTAARSEPAAARTARRSSMRSSSVESPTSRSESPVPRLSKRITRLKAASRLHPVAVERILPGEVHVRDPARDDDEVERSVADDLVGNADVAALGVACLGAHQLRLALSATERILTNRRHDRMTAEL